MKKFWDLENKYTKGFLKEYNHWILEVSYRQHTFGCYIIFVKRPVEKISNISDNEIRELKIVMGEIEEALGRNPIFKPNRFNYWQLGNSLHQLHFHGIPRYSSPRIFDGRTWVDERFGHSPLWSELEESNETISKFRDAIMPYFPR